MTERMTPERLAEIRAWAAEWKRLNPAAAMVDDVLAHLDAVTRERDELSGMLEMFGSNRLVASAIRAAFPIEGENTQ